MLRLPILACLLLIVILALPGSAARDSGHRPLADLTYAAYLGGRGADAAAAIAVDGAGNIYMTGGTYSPDFPTRNPYQPALHGGRDAFLTKLDPSGAAVYSTYLGGSGDDYGTGIAVDASGAAYVTGSTASTDFPLLHPLQPAYAGADDVFVTKLDPAGVPVYSTYLGGSGADEGGGIAVDGAGAAYLTGNTASANFPRARAYQPALGGDFDAFVTKVDPAGSALVYSTYLGGSDVDAGAGIAVDGAGAAYVAGYTRSANFPLAAAYQPALAGLYDAFVTKLAPDGAAPIYSTYLGGAADDYGTGIAVDSSGAAYIAGYTASANFPLVSPLQPTFAGPTDAFLAKLDPAGVAPVYATYVGGGGADRGAAVAVDSTGAAYVAGQTASATFPLVQPVQAHYGGGLWDAFALKVDPPGHAALYATYLGGAGDDTAAGIAVDGAGHAYLAGATTSTDLPGVAPGGPPNAGAGDAFVAVLADLAPPASPTPMPIPPGLTPSPTPTRTPAITSSPSPRPGTPTASPTPAGCQLAFVDVPDGQPFYPYIRCLACQGTAGGYRCGGVGEPCPGSYFRPSADVTRGQLAKIVANAAGLAAPVPAGQQTFADVSGANAFWLPIERLAALGMVSGYACGGPREPCDGASRPYFRSNGNATRGQIAKIVANAAGLGAPVPPTQQSFADIPPGSPFWLFIERLAAVGAVSGYACGGPAEPCDAATRPYFRSGANTTRGQMAKIAANTFFPGCAVLGARAAP